MRPTTLAEYAGQSKLLAEGGVLQTMLLQGNLSSFILWGPPGVGKTTLARIIASQTQSKWILFPARDLWHKRNQNRDG